MNAATATRAQPKDEGSWLNVRMHEGQLGAWQSLARTKVIRAGRRWGKSEFGVLWLTAGAIDDHLKGQSGVSWWVAPTYNLTRPIWRKFFRTVAKAITGKHGSEGQPDFLEIGASRIEFKPADHPERLVAEGLRRVVVDECGIIKEPVWKESLLPALIDHAAPALLMGTPKGRNWFYRMNLRGLDPEDETVATFGGPSFENPFIDRAEVERLASEMPQRLYRQEILAEFLDDEGAVFRGIRNCVGEVSPGATAVLGVDLAKHVDFTVIVGMDSGGNVTSFDRFREISWPLQKERIIAAAKGGVKVILDSTGVGDPVLDDLVKAGVDVEGYRFTAPSKQQLIEALAIGIEQQEIRMPDEPVLVNELEAFEFETGRTGRIHYGAPEGAHDDCVIALALAWWGASRMSLYDLDVLNA